MEKEIINYRGIDIEISQDEYCESPDHWGNTDIFLVYNHRQFDVRRKGFEPRDIFDYLQSLNHPNDEYDFSEYYIFGVDAYIHSGVHLSLANTRNYPDRRWDVSTTGFILVSKKDIDFPLQKKHNPKLENKTNEEIARHYAESLIETWNEYLSGDVWGYNSEYGSCWGFYGDSGKEQMIEEAKSEIDYALKKLEQKRQEKLKVYIKNHVPLNKRIYA